MFDEPLGMRVKRRKKRIRINVLQLKSVYKLHHQGEDGERERERERERELKDVSLHGG